MSRHSSPIVVLRVYLPAGSAFDPPQAPGLANLTAELLSRGTARRAGPALDEAIEFVGGSLEASAGRDGATVSLAVLKKDLGLGLDLLSEVLTQPTFPADELARKVKEIQAAIRRSEENPESVASRALGELLYPGHPYGHPVTGTVESVGKLTREQVLAFYRAHYRPDRAILVVAGDVKADEIRQELLHRLASWSAGGAPSRPP
ncbi:MAG: insulinase family protein, partial [Candidatus Rokubacteria bacterium]|nr:insulinase family protein [Candidatus Rokubacteria bacterium]